MFVRAQRQAPSPLAGESQGEGESHSTPSPVSSPLKGEEKTGRFSTHIFMNFIISSHRHVWLLAVSVLLCTLTSLTYAERLPYSLSGGAVTYTFPKRWSLQQVSRNKKMETLQFVITLSAPGDPPRTTHAILIAEPNPENLTIADISAKKISKTYKLVADYPEGDSWRTVLSQVPDSKPPYAVLDRFGVTAKVRVHLRIVLPSEGEATAKWPNTLTKDSNEVIRKLGINLRNTVGVELRYADGNWELLQSQTVTQNVLQRPAPPPPKPPVSTPPSDQLFTPQPDDKSTLPP